MIWNDFDLFTHGFRQLLPIHPFEIKASRDLDQWEAQGDMVAVDPISYLAGTWGSLVSSIGKSFLSLIVMSPAFMPATR